MWSGAAASGRCFRRDFPDGRHSVSSFPVPERTGLVHLLSEHIGWGKTRLDGTGSRTADRCHGQPECKVGITPLGERSWRQQENKGIKRHVTVDSNGYVIGVSVTSANVHDSKGAIPLIAQLVVNHRDIHLLKTDLGYVSLGTALSNIESPVLECIKSNFGTPHFIPINGRWVVERTFSWMENYRRLTRNYVRLLKVARHIFIVGCLFFMLRYFAWYIDCQYCWLEFLIPIQEWDNTSYPYL